MKKITLSLLIFSIFILPSGCSLLGSKSTVYITTDTIGATLTTVKFLEPADNAGDYTNKYSTYTGTTSAAGYDWWVYEVADGTYDVYIEWTDGIGFNGRTRTTLDSTSDLNTWTAVYADTGGNVWSEEGSGSFSPGLYQYP